LEAVNSSETAETGKKIAEWGKAKSDNEHQILEYADPNSATHQEINKAHETVKQLEKEKPALERVKKAAQDALNAKPAPPPQQNRQPNSTHHSDILRDIRPMEPHGRTDVPASSRDPGRTKDS